MFKYFHVFKYADATLEVDNKYKYLGVFLNEFLKCDSVASLLAESSGSALEGMISKFNKRPRAMTLCLITHMLVKRIPVMYKLSSTNIPEYLSQSGYKVVKSWKSTK